MDMTEESKEEALACMEALSLEKFEEATEAVSRVISETKLVYSEHIYNLTGYRGYFKTETMPYT